MEYVATVTGASSSSTSPVCSISRVRMPGTSGRSAAWRSAHCSRRADWVTRVTSPPVARWISASARAYTSSASCEARTAKGTSIEMPRSLILSVAQYVRHSDSGRASVACHTVRMGGMSSRAYATNSCHASGSLPGEAISMQNFLISLRPLARFWIGAPTMAPAPARSGGKWDRTACAMASRKCSGWAPE